MELLMFFIRAVISALMSLISAVAGLTTSSAVNAASVPEKGTGEISCAAAKIRATPDRDALARGVAYRGDTLTYSEFVYVRSERTWYTRGTITRAHDRAEISGLILYTCATPYGDKAAPIPPRVN
ncbi:hypothetical protein [Streptomyces sp. NPDC059063]|uniref:hypothetical protein n=1 Tax=unclassified Streptomyces TaxID=2593676 RepID=UPI00367C9449